MKKHREYNFLRDFFFLLKYIFKIERKIEKDLYFLISIQKLLYGTCTVTIAFTASNLPINFFFFNHHPLLLINFNRIFKWSKTLKVPSSSLSHSHFFLNPISHLYRKTPGADTISGSWQLDLHNARTLSGQGLLCPGHDLTMLSTKEKRFFILDFYPGGDPEKTPSFVTEHVSVGVAYIHSRQI